MKSIGKIDNLLNDVIEELLKTESVLTEGELKDFLTVLRAQSGEKANIMRKRIMFLGLHRIGAEISSLLWDEGKRKVVQIAGLSKDIFECFNSVNVYFFEKGEIENYYITDIGNQYKIADNKKTDYYLQEYQNINEMDKKEIEKTTRI